MRQCFHEPLCCKVQSNPGSDHGSEFVLLLFTSIFLLVRALVCDIFLLFHTIQCLKLLDHCKDLVDKQCQCSYLVIEIQKNSD
jgi:hypothetical protein